MTNSPYYSDPTGNAVFTLETVVTYITDPVTGNITKATQQHVNGTASVRQKKDPNLQVQSGVDYSRIYFEGRLINPRSHIKAFQGKGVPAVINGRSGVFDFVPLLETDDVIALATSNVVGQKIAGYFRLV